MREVEELFNETYLRIETSREIVEWGKIANLPFLKALKGLEKWLNMLGTDTHLFSSVFLAEKRISEANIDKIFQDFARSQFEITYALK